MTRSGLSIRFAEWQQAALPTAIRDIHVLQPARGLEEALSRVISALADERMLLTVVKARVFELLAWLIRDGAFFAPFGEIGMVRRIRRTIAEEPDIEWTADMMAARFNMSGATFRRHLAEQGTAFRTQLIDVRMMRALSLL